MNTRSLRLLPLLVALFVFLGCCIEIRSCQPIVVNIREIGTCRGYHEKTLTPEGITDTFSVDDERIYLYYYLETTVEVSLSYRWYHEDTLVYMRQDDGLTEGYHFTWISPKEGERFLVGDHRVEILMRSLTLATVEFRVEGERQTWTDADDANTDVPERIAAINAWREARLG